MDKVIEALMKGKKASISCYGGFGIEGFASVEQEARISYIRAVNKFRIDFFVNDVLVLRKNLDDNGTIQKFIEWNIPLDWKIEA